MMFHFLFQKKKKYKNLDFMQQEMNIGKFSCGMGKHKSHCKGN